jgi:hypothetical protein
MEEISFTVQQKPRTVLFDEILRILGDFDRCRLFAKSYLSLSDSPGSIRVGYLDRFVRINRNLDCGDFGIVNQQR